MKILGHHLNHSVVEPADGHICATFWVCNRCKLKIKGCVTLANKIIPCEDVASNMNYLVKIEDKQCQKHYITIKHGQTVVKIVKHH